MQHYLLVGNYGLGNAGDEALREYFLERFPEVEWSVLSAHPSSSNIPFLPSGLRSFFSFRWLRTLRILRQADGMVFGGGSLFTDAESVRACWIWFCHAWIALLFRKPVLLAFQGIGPFRTRRGAWFAHVVCLRAAFISVRDSASFARVKAWKKNTEIVQSFDPSLLLLEENKTQSRVQKLFIYIPRFSTGEMDRKVVMNALKILQKKGNDVLVLSLQSGDPRERRQCELLEQELGGKVIAISSLSRALPLLSAGSRIITQRYHGAILAVAAGISFVALPQQQGDKLDAIAHQFGQFSIMPSAVTGEALLTLPLGMEKFREARAMCVRDALRGEQALREALRRLASA